MKKALSFMIAALMLLSLAGCTKYSSKYNAVGFVHSDESDSAFMSFYSFDGTMVFQLKSTGEGDLKYSAQLESGSATVYYDFYGRKEELFSVSSGDKKNARGGYIEDGTVTIIVETNGECRNGDFRFSLE